MAKSTQTASLNDTLPEKKKGKQLSKKALQERVRPYAMDAVKVLVREMKEGDNSNARIGAAKAILAKVLPDLKATELSGKDGNAFKVIIERYGEDQSKSTKETRDSL